MNDKPLRGPNNKIYIFKESRTKDYVTFLS